MKNIIFAALAGAMLASCSGTKDLPAARVDMPDTFVEGAEGYVKADSMSIADIKWWEFYADSTLTKIMRIALDNNRDILKAAARVEQSRHLYGVAVAEMWPQVGVNVAYSYETNKYNGGELIKDPEHDLKFPITWEVNLWGSMIRAKDAGKAR